MGLPLDLPLPKGGPVEGLSGQTFCGIRESLREREYMPKVCEICGKGPMFGQSVSHSHKATKKKWKPNLQQVKAQTAAGVKRVWVCTKCLRAGKVAKAR
jgi:large subunit ribosomal protein L28